jgi:hypothetical protein
MKKTFILSFINLMILNTISFAQSFAPPALQTGSTAVKKDSTIIISWATGITIERGYMNIANKSGGLVSYGGNSEGIGVAQGNSNEVVSLGDSGVAVLTFDQIIENGIGPDFAVFENGFSDGFLEFAHVEVSSDGVNYFRFPSTSEAPVINQIGPFVQTNNCRYYNNLAGKYRQGYGTPFDLDELSGINGLDISAVTHVKLIDVIGSVDAQYGSVDNQGTLINDLYPTEFPSGGFDLDGVAILSRKYLSVEEKNFKTSIYPNPTSDFLNINVEEKSVVRILNSKGEEFVNEEFEGFLSIDLTKFSSTLLFVEISNIHLNRTEKVVVLK